MWLQCKQDESDEFVSGETFYPSRIAPVAPGFEDGRFWRFVDMLREARIEVAAWVPAFNDARAAEQNPDWRAHRLSEGGSPEPQPDWL